MESYEIEIWKLKKLIVKVFCVAIKYHRNRETDRQSLRNWKDKNEWSDFFIVDYEGWRSRAKSLSSKNFDFPAPL